jgi:hypothetical protein
VSLTRQKLHSDGRLTSRPSGQAGPAVSPSSNRETLEPLAYGSGVLLFDRHCQSKIYTACSRTMAGWSSTVFARELPPRSAGFNAENRLYSFALTMPNDLLGFGWVRIRLAVEYGARLLVDWAAAVSAVIARARSELTS